VPEVVGTAPDGLGVLEALAGWVPVPAGAALDVVEAEPLDAPGPDDCVVAVLVWEPLCVDELLTPGRLPGTGRKISALM
jgi:hypothetical protein